uniref:Uncharacterized protein n=1 Tax=viral metagenome TaxID=1070528 RepID=A0A6C0ED66_9ZZZZ
MPKKMQKPKQGKSCKKPKNSKINMIVGHTHKVSFNLKKNYVENFYCPNLPSNESDEVVVPINLDSIEDFPEIPLNDLLNSA